MQTQAELSRASQEGVSIGSELQPAQQGPPSAEKALRGKKATRAGGEGGTQECQQQKSRDSTVPRALCLPLHCCPRWAGTTHPGSPSVTCHQPTRLGCRVQGGPAVLGQAHPCTSEMLESLLPSSAPSPHPAGPRGLPSSWLPVHFPVFP